MLPLFHFCEPGNIEHKLQLCSSKTVKQFNLFIVATSKKKNILMYMLVNGQWTFVYYV